MIARSIENQQLIRAQACLIAFSDQYNNSPAEARFQALEAVASRLGGFELETYQTCFGVKPVTRSSQLLAVARKIVEHISDTDIPPALAVSALAREVLDHSKKRNAGAYHTDFRLAQHVASGLRPQLVPGAQVIDPACGAGILLVAATLEACGADRRLTSRWLANSVFASDLSPMALRGARTALACLTDDISALSQMQKNWRVSDSLTMDSTEWQKLAPGGFDVVVANPPWEKVKLTRHEFIQSEGVERHYGTDYKRFDVARYHEKKGEVRSYGAALANTYVSLGSGEPDLYMAFTELSVRLAKPGASIGIILPAGLIRSKGTETLRRLMWSESSSLSFEIFENRARFFEIDTRFKFLVARLTKRSARSRLAPIEVGHAKSAGVDVIVSDRVRMGRAVLNALRPDLSVPEVRTEAEWRLFQKICATGVDWSEPQSPWHPDFMREIDMTRDREFFSPKLLPHALPLIEGRMVHQHRFGAKSYVSGRGRSAEWRINSPGESQVCPQFWVLPKNLTQKALVRTTQMRAGFCDITGQTNERTCMAAIVPPGTVCGNKVPTVLFPNDPTESRLWLWIAIVNSLPFDWSMRRVTTTTLNYFVMLSIPLPPIEPLSLPGQTLVSIAKKLAQLDMAGDSKNVWWEIAELRAKADSIVLSAYGLKAADLRLMLADFPLLDRAQPPIRGEPRSTVTSDLLMLRSLEKARMPTETRSIGERLEAARAVGAIPFLPSQLRLAEDDIVDGAANA